MQPCGRLAPRAVPSRLEGGDALNKRVVVLGATGYVGGRLVPRLLDRGHEVVALVRDARGLEGRAWRDEVEIVEGEVCEIESLGEFDLSVYLAHVVDDLDEALALAEAFGKLAEDRPIIYLGGTTPRSHRASHLEQKREVGETLSQYGPTTELRCGVVVGSGSASHQAIRSMVERFPLIVGPSAFDREFRPIAIDDLLDLLMRAIEGPQEGVFEAGGLAIRVRDTLEVAAEELGLNRKILVSKLMPPGLARWLAQVGTPVSSKLIGGLIDSLDQVQAPSVAKTEEAFGIEFRDYRSAFRAAEEEDVEMAVESRYTDDAPLAPVSPKDVAGLCIYEKSFRAEVSQGELWSAVSNLRHTSRYGSTTWLWQLRGLADRLLDGPGYGLGRRRSESIRVGDTVDWWRVAEVDPPQRLQLSAEMRVPGEAWLVIGCEDAESGSRLTIRAVFRPNGWLGRAYWYALAVPHVWVFDALAKSIVRDAEERIEVPA